MALGVKEVVSPFHAAADVYLEGFPFGSLTALLEAGLYGLPCVGAPGTTPLPLKSDDLGLEQMRTPAGAEDYILEALRLAGDPQARAVEGERTQTAIRQHHCGAGWLQHLARVYDRLPERHHIWQRATHPVSEVIRDYWISFQRALTGAGIAELLMSAYAKAEWRGLRLVESSGQRLDSDLLELARKWLCEMHAYDGYRAYVEKDRHRLLTNFFRSLYIAPSNMRNRFLAGLVVKSMLGDRSKERLRRLGPWLRSNCLRTSG
jgi:IS1 family transposase